MNMLFYKMRIGKNGQIISILTLTLVIFIIAAFLAVNLGKNNIQDARINNAAKAGVLAGGSSACVLLNSMANLNDNMVMNFVGFSIQMQVALVSWTIDYITTITTAAATLTWFNVPAVTKTILSVASICIATSSLAIMITGATKTGNAVYKMIKELNDKLPKNSRDSARQYAFSNAGIDEPKVPFSKSGCSDARCYSLIETKFDEFMRELPDKNKADKSYGTSTIDFSWDDSRTDHVVKNKVAVTVTPVQKVPLTLMRYKDISAEAGTINSYLSTQSLGWLGGMAKVGVSLAGVVIGLIWGTAAMITALAVYLGILAAVEYGFAATYYTIAAVYTACCAIPYTALVCCPLASLFYSVAVYYTSAAGTMTGCAIAAGVASAAFFAVYSATPPGEIPCFVWEKNNKTHPITVEVSRVTTPASINYGVYTTEWPTKDKTASGVVKFGSIFPPSQLFDVAPDF